ncbi:hypothetical protein JCM10213v2_003624 [Rhodosporidiobolus nylandii]
MAGREPNFEEIYAFAVQLAKDAGAMILEGSSKRTASAADSGLETKKNSVDLVTETGQAVEAFIKSRIASAYPSFKFVHVIDFVCCSIGFTYKQVPVIGSAALNYSFVAAGQLDLYWEIGYWSWDVCAGTIIAREAGGKVYGNSGAPLQPQDLMGHHFFVVRAIGDTLDAEGKVVETGEQAQDRIAKAFF